MTRFERRFRLALIALMSVTVSVMAVSPSAATGGPVTTGMDLDRYLGVATAVWLSPLGLTEKLVRVNTRFAPGSGLDDVALTVDNVDSYCDPSRPRLVLATQLMLYHGMRLRCWEYNEPAPGVVSPEKVTSRINAVLEWLKSEHKLTARFVEPHEGDLIYELCNEGYTGEAWFDKDKGFLSALDLKPRQR